MKKDWDPQRLDVRGFARLAGALSGQAALSDLPRLLAEQTATGADAAPVMWSLNGQIRDLRGGAHQTWMQVQAQATLHMMCQRCLEPMAMPLSVDRQFRFVTSEQVAAAEDDQSEEDLLVASTQFDALTLIEDELILAMPLVPRHASCPSPMPLAGEMAT